MILLFAGVVTGLLLSALFSGSEIAYISVPTSQFPRLLSRPLARWFTEHPDRVFATILFGNNLANAMVAILLAVALYRIRPEAETWVLSGAGATLLLILFGEILPKTLARRMGTFLIPWLFPLLYAFGQVLTPLLEAYLSLWRRILSMSRERLLLQEISWALLSLRRHRSRHVGPWALKLALDFMDQPVHTVMIPAHRLRRVPASASFDEVLSHLCRVPWNRLFVYDEDPDNIIGIIHIKDLLRTQNRPDTWPQRIRPPVRVLASWPLSRVLEVLRKSQVPIALVVDERGTLRGMVSDEILFETMVSFFWPQGKWGPGVEVSTFLPLRTLKLHGVPIEGPDEESLASWMLRKLNALPGPEMRRFTLEGLRFEITERMGSRIEKVRIWWDEPGGNP